MATELVYDVVIVGAGPAGCQVAINLKSDYSVLIIDKNQLPRDKSCAGVLKPSVLDILKPLKIPEYVFAQPKVLGVIGFDFNLGLLLKAPYNKYFNVDRKKFDWWLLEQAQKNQSLTVYSGTKLVGFKINGDSMVCTLKRNSRVLEVRTKLLVGADGAGSFVRRQITPQIPLLCHTMQAYFKANSQISLADFIGVLDKKTYLYDWILPKNGALVIGAAYAPGSKDLHTKFNEYLEKMKRVLNITGEIVQGPRGYPITSLTSAREICPGYGCVLLVGEAAGLIDASLGEGISYALRSGQICAQAINKAFPNPLPLYSSLLRPLKRLAAWDLFKMKLYTRRGLRPLLYRIFPQMKIVGHL
jgi:geranylgeranyl reductase family protein